MNTESRDYYLILDVAPTASQDEITDAWHRQLEIWRPELFLNDASMQLTAKERLNEIREAYGILGNPEKRQVYDMGKGPGSYPGHVETKTTSSYSLQSPDEGYRLAFHGSGRELFDIFIVNVLKTIAPWGSIPSGPRQRLVDTCGHSPSLVVIGLTIMERRRNF